MRSNLPVEIVMASLVVVIGGSLSFNAAKTALAYDKFYREEGESLESVSRRTGVPANELVRFGEVYLPLSYESDSPNRVKDLIQAELQAVLATKASEGAREIGTVKEEIARGVQQIRSPESPEMFRGTIKTVVHLEEVDRILIPKDLSDFVANDLLMAATRPRGLSSFWQQMVNIIEDGKAINYEENVSVGGIAPNGVENVLLLSTIQNSRDPSENRGARPAYLIRVEYEKSLSSVLLRLISKKYVAPGVFDFEPISVRSSKIEEMGVVVTIEGVQFLFLKERWNLFLEDPAISRQIFSIKVHERIQISLSVDSDVDDEFRQFFEEVFLAEESLETQLDADKYFKAFDFLGEYHAVVRQQFVTDLTESSELWNKRCELADFIRSHPKFWQYNFSDTPGSKRPRVEIRSKSEGVYYRDSYSYGALHAWENSKLNKIKEAGSGHSFDKADFYSPETADLVTIARGGGTNRRARSPLLRSFGISRWFREIHEEKGSVRYFSLMTDGSSSSLTRIQLELDEAGWDFFWQ
ncbi:MAG: hypothetical protein KDN20_07480 [Verrucomicrobiae bacterium]|nr:hypothetical protein [Verrucomicrobiae bacterium]